MISPCPQNAGHAVRVVPADRVRATVHRAVQMVEVLQEVRMAAEGHLAGRATEMGRRRRADPGAPAVRVVLTGRAALVPADRPSH